MNGIDIKRLTKDDDFDLVDFLDTTSLFNPSILAYHYPFYRDILFEIGVGEPIYFSAIKNSKIIGLLPVFKKTENNISVISSLPFFGPNGGVITSLSEDKSLIETLLLTHLLRFAKEEKVLSCSVYTPFLMDDLSSYKRAFTSPMVVKKFTQYLQINNTSFDTGLIGKNIRKAKKSGVQIDTNLCQSSIDSFYEIYKSNCEEFAIPRKEKLCINLLLNTKDSSKHAKLYIAKIDNRIIGGLLVLYSKLTASYYVPCSLTSMRSAQASTLLIERAIRDLSQKGIRYLNFESSPSRESGVYAFKKKWGCVESTYNIFIQPYNIEAIRCLGKIGIEESFKHFFVFPFDNLTSIAR